MCMSSFTEIGYRANVYYKNTSNDDHVFIYEDHRTILNVIFDINRILKSNDPIDIYLFDRHDDFCDSPVDDNDIQSFHDNPTKEFLNELVEFKSSFLDDDWIKLGMELNLIGNVFLFNNKEDSNSSSFINIYETKYHGIRKLYNIGEVWSALGYHGALSDISQEPKYKDLWKDMGWNLNYGQFRFDSNRNHFIVDIDLDCFTTDIYGNTYAIPHHILKKTFLDDCHQSTHGFNTAQEFMIHLIKLAEAVTICYEAGCCGGIRQTQHIFNTIDGLFFDYELGE